MPSLDTQIGVSIDELTATHPTFGLELLQPRIGAQISGIDFRLEIDDVTKSHLRALLLAYKVLFFGEQPLSRNQYVRMARIFGTPMQTPLPSIETNPEIIEVSSDRSNTDTWHSDLSWQVHPAERILLRSVELPPTGGDTLWADAEAAFDSLSDDLKKRIEGLYAVHDVLGVLSHQRTDKPEYEKRAQHVLRNRRTHPLVAHPIVRKHPLSGRSILYVNPTYTNLVVGLERAESDRLLQQLFQSFLRPEVQVRFRWSPDAIAAWDNRSTLHYGVWDYGQFRRRMEQIPLRSERPRYWEEQVESERPALSFSPGS